MGSTWGVTVVAAQRVGCSVDEYIAHLAADEKWCYVHRAWHPLDAFGLDASRGDGRCARCRLGKSVDPKKYRPCPQRGHRLPSITTVTSP